MESNWSLKEILSLFTVFIHKCQCCFHATPFNQLEKDRSQWEKSTATLRWGGQREGGYPNPDLEGEDAKDWISTNQAMLIESTV